MPRAQRRSSSSGGSRKRAASLPRLRQQWRRLARPTDDIDHPQGCRLLSGKFRLCTCPAAAAPCACMTLIAAELEIRDRLVLPVQPSGASGTGWRAGTCPPGRRATLGTAQGRFPDIQQTLPERQQAAQQVAAVDGRNVARLQRPQGQRVVPVVKMALVALEPVQGVEGFSRRSSSWSRLM